MWLHPTIIFNCNVSCVHTFQCIYFHFALVCTRESCGKNRIWIFKYLDLFYFKFHFNGIANFVWLCLIAMKEIQLRYGSKFVMCLLYLCYMNWVVTVTRNFLPDFHFYFLHDLHCLSLRLIALQFWLFTQHWYTSVKRSQADFLKLLNWIKISILSICLQC